MLRGEIWLVNFEPATGSEIGKIRPAVILTNNSIGILPLKEVAPITDWKDVYNSRKWMVLINPDPITNHLDKLSGVDTFQLKSIDRSRFIRKIGDMSPSDIKKINEAIILALDIH
jgi:mRNA interferase MazF